jgi:hypothetical protein
VILNELNGAGQSCFNASMQLHLARTNP